MADGIGYREVVKLQVVHGVTIKHDDIYYMKLPSGHYRDRRRIFPGRECSRETAALATMNALYVPAASK